MLVNWQYSSLQFHYLSSAVARQLVGEPQPRVRPLDGDLVVMATSVAGSRGRKAEERERAHSARLWERIYWAKANFEGRRRRRRVEKARIGQFAHTGAPALLVNGKQARPVSIAANDIMLVLERSCCCYVRSSARSFAQAVLARDALSSPAQRSNGQARPNQIQRRYAPSFQTAAAEITQINCGPYQVPAWWGATDLRRLLFF